MKLFDQKKIGLIVPVYAGLTELTECLNSIFQSENKTRFELLAIYDQGPEPEILDYLKHLEQQGQLSLLINDSNLGFVKTVNKGLAYFEALDCIILNSDTVVANAWIDRLCQHASKPSVATVTPFSNNAEICSFPNFCESNELFLQNTTESIDKVFASGVQKESIEIPTGVGFCMYISRQALKKCGNLDEQRFGIGYGEENDLCVRFAQAGFKNVLATNIFVQHIGEVSFSDQKQALIRRSMYVLDQLHPKYHIDVAKHIDKDPAQAHRLQAMFNLIGTSERPAVLHINHNLGGGTQKYVDELAQFTAKDANHILLQPLSATKVQLDFDYCAAHYTISFTLPAEQKLLQRCLSSLRIQLVHLHHIMGLEKNLSNLLKILKGKPLITSLHDYYFINGRPTLCVPGEVFDIASAQQKLPTELDRTLACGISVKTLRSLSDSVFSMSTVILAPSAAAREIYQQFFPEHTISNAFHPDHKTDYPYPAIKVKTPSRVARILVIGALSIEKGADLLESVAGAAAMQGYALDFVLLGYAYRPLDGIVSTLGAYNDEDLEQQLADLSPDIVWFPAVWGETYSYTLSTCLKVGIPVLAPNLGAFKERTQNRPYTSIEEASFDENIWVSRIIKLVERLQKQSEPAAWSDQPKATDFYEYSYLSYIDSKKVPAEEMNTSFDFFRKLTANRSVNKPLGERILHSLFRSRGHAIVNKIAKSIPMGAKERLRYLLLGGSAVPAHELISQKKENQ